MLCFLRARSTPGALEGYCRAMCTKLASGKSRANFFHTKRDFKNKHLEGGEGHLGFEGKQKKNTVFGSSLKVKKERDDYDLKGTCVKVSKIARLNLWDEFGGKTLCSPMDLSI